MSAAGDRSLPTEVVEAAAAAWLSLRDRGMSSAETAALLRWLQEDPRHAELFAELDRTWRRFDRLAAVPAAPAASGVANPDTLAPRARPRRRLAPAWLAFGAAAILAAGFFTTSALRPPRHAAETEIGAFHKLDLPDGSVAQLNTDSAIDVAFTAGERRVRVVRGEVFFTVARDPARPFLVAAGPIVVRAVGTAFNVRHRADAVEVLVTEGRVALARTGDSAGRDAAASSAGLPPDPAAGLPSSELAAGERAIVSLSAARATRLPAATVVERVAASAVQRALAWQERRLEFDAAPLAEVVREFNRYNRHQLVIADEKLAGRRFSGTFRADGYETLVRLLEGDFGVTVVRHGHEIVLRAGP